MLKFSKKHWLYIAFFTALVIIFYIVIALVVPGFTERKIAPINTVRPFAFTTQDGLTLTNNDMVGKIYAVEFFYTTCPGICPRMNKNMRTVYDALNKENDFYILSFTCDPKTDSAAKLKLYADSLQVDTKKWVFLTGRKDSLYNAARLSFSIDDPKNFVKNEDDDFMHSQNWALVDREGNVIGIYDGLRKGEVNDLIKKAKKMLKEE